MEKAVMISKEKVCINFGPHGADFTRRKNHIYW